MTALKWILIAVLALQALSVAILPLRPRQHGATLGLALLAVKKQRFGLLVVSLLAAFMLLSGTTGGLFDEAPDLVRSWWDGSACRPSASKPGSPDCE